MLRTFLAALALVWCPVQDPPPAAGAIPTPVPNSVRNIVIITLDTTRADHLGCYGYFRDTSPKLDQLAEQSLRFTRCYAPVAQTTPSHVSLFTSVYPFEHGVLANTLHGSKAERASVALKTGPTLSTFAQAMQRRALKTGGFVSGTTVKRFTGIAAGFDAWSEPIGERRMGAKTILEVLRWLDSLGDAPFFLWVHLFDAHGPYQPPSFPPRTYLELFKTDDAQRAWLAARRFPEDAAGRRDVSPPEANNIYDSALRFQDDQFGVLLDRLNSDALRNSTALVVVGDHGHGLGQHGFMSHGICYSEQLEVPLLLRVPGVAPGVVNRLVSTIDAIPTLLGLVPTLRDEGFEAQCRGVDALATDFEERPLFNMSAPQRGLLSLITPRWHLILRDRNRLELFDLAADPFELTDVSSQHADIVKQIARLLEHEIDEQRKRGQIHHPEGVPEDPLSADVLLQLKALGYADDDADAGDAGDGG